MLASYNLTREVQIIDLALFLPQTKTLILCDLHIGYEESLNKKGVLVPRVHFTELHEKIKQILEQTKPKQIIINGDFKHEFGTISETEWRHALRMIDLFSKYTPSLLFVQGNHDTFLGPLARKKKMTIAHYVIINHFLIAHGDTIIDINKTAINTIIIGHEHPAVSLRLGMRTETYKCFLKGKYGAKQLVVMPSCNTLVQGTDVLKEKLLSPYLKQVDDFEIFVVEDTIYPFGKVKKLRKKL